MLDGLDGDVSGRFEEALLMAAEGMAIMRQNLRRRYPDESDQQIEKLLDAWVDDRPMDAPGRVVEGAFP